MRRRETPAYRPLIRLVLMMVLWRQRTPTNGCFALSADFAPVDARIRSGCARNVDLIERIVVAALEILNILVENHIIALLCATDSLLGAICPTTIKGGAGGIRTLETCVSTF